MGPIEILFLVLMAVFGVVGVVRGYAQELGVTTMLLLALFILQFIGTEVAKPFDSLLAFVAGPGTAEIGTVRAFVFSGFLILIAFISYQGQTLSFPGRGESVALSLTSGLLNGYLFAGSLWYYLGSANWPYLNVNTNFSDFYKFAWNLLPPKILPWPYLIGLAVFMLIMRVWK